MWYKPKEPYEPWEVKESDFPKAGTVQEKARFLLNYAILAPSTCNVQPWLFSIDKNKITIQPDFSRRLRTSDKDNALMHISLGCTLKNLEVAAKAFGFRADKRFIKKASNTIIEVTLVEGSRKILESHLQVIKRRLGRKVNYG